jgi:signal transduction histidine kinase
LLDLQDRDRQLISCELHDGLVQQLIGAIMRFEVGKLDAGLEMLRACMKEARSLIHGLRPPILDECGLVAAIADLSSQDNGDGKLTVEFTHRITSDRLPPSLENAIFRIIQESLTNARRYSQSMKVRIRLVQREDGIRIEVEDWGVGFNPKNIAEGHFGLAGINERARLFGGAAIIRSSPGKGTRIVVELPLTASSLDTVARRQSVLH